MNALQPPAHRRTPPTAVISVEYGGRQGLAAGYFLVYLQSRTVILNKNSNFRQDLHIFINKVLVFSTMRLLTKKNKVLTINNMTLKVRKP